MIDATHDPARRSWVPGADGHPDFPIQNLPLGRFIPPGGGGVRDGVAIGDAILDLAAAAPLLGGAWPAAPGAAGRRGLRAAVGALLDAAAAPRPELIHDAAGCTMQLPHTIGDYTDFYAGIHHARAVGALLRPEAPLLPNYHHLPVAYHGRASSVVVSGTPVRRPAGQRKRADEAGPSFGPSRNLDYELELGIWIGVGNALGEPIPIGAAGDHIAGYCLLNDWSARDIQGFEYQPLGPFLGKSFCTTVSAWVVTPEALAPFRVAQAARETPAPTHLLDAADQAGGALAVALEVWLTPAGGAPVRVATSDARHLHWTPAQMVAHHASNGCNLRAGDLLGTGTISGPGRGEEGSLLEATRGGREPLLLGDGAERRFLEAGDAVELRARARADGFVSIGFGACRGVVLA